MNLGVGWVEERNPTPTISGFVGFHECSTQPTNILFFRSNKRALIHQGHDYARYIH